MKELHQLLFTHFLTQPDTGKPSSFYRVYEKAIYSEMCSYSKKTNLLNNPTSLTLHHPSLTTPV